MESLRHLYLGSTQKIKEDFRIVTWRLDGLSELETLQFNETFTVDVGDFLKLTSLRKLEAKVDWRNFEGMIKYLSCSGDQLHHSSLEIHKSFSSEKDSDLLGLFTCHHLNKFQILGRIEKLPKHQNLSPNLTRLRLVNSGLKEDPMATLEKLPELRLLLLNNGFEGQEMVCSGMGFPKLKLLRLVTLPNLEEWRVDEGAMPNLSSLKIQDCMKLKMLPDGLRFITTLQELRIRDMLEAFTRRLEAVDGEEGADVYKVKHVPSLTIW